jgi:hypothetical protein
MFSFRPFGNHYGVPSYMDSQSLGYIKHQIRAYMPCTTKFKALTIGYRKWAVLSFSPHTVGPNLVGYISEES